MSLLLLVLVSEPNLSGLVKSNNREVLIVYSRVEYGYCPDACLQKFSRIATQR